MQEEEHIQRIEAYVKKTLTEEERLQFESDLASDTALRMLYAQHKFILDGVQGMKIHALTESLKHNNNKLPNRQRFMLLLSIAAGILVLVCIFFLLQRPDANEKLALTYYEAPLADLERSDHTSQDSIYQSGMIAFDQKNWKQAAVAFQKIESTHPLHVQAQYFLAHALVGDRRFSEAETLFNELALKPGQYRQQSQWNGILVLLRLDASQEILMENLKPIVSDPTHFYYHKAQELQQDLRKLKD
jgi:hypothetical protein